MKALIIAAALAGEAPEVNVVRWYGTSMHTRIEVISDSKDRIRCIGIDHDGDIIASTESSAWTGIIHLWHVLPDDLDTVECEYLRY